MAKIQHIRRPRYRDNRRRSPRLQAFLSAMATKWAGLGATITATSVGANAIDLPSTPDCAGPFTIVGVPPPELRSVARFWVSVAAGDILTLYRTRNSLRDGKGPIAIAAWALSFTFATTDVTVAADTITETAHGMETGDGPVRVSSSTTLPAGLAAATDYWVIRVDANTFKLATSRANALAGTAIDLTSQGTGTHTLTRDVKLAKDFSAGGMLEWLAQGVKPRTMNEAATGSVDAVFK